MENENNTVNPHICSVCQDDCGFEYCSQECKEKYEIFMKKLMTESPDVLIEIVPNFKILTPTRFGK